MSYSGNGARKVDDLAINGLLGTYNSLGYHVETIENYFQNTEKWYGRNAVSGLMEINNPAPWQLVAGALANTWGTEVMLSDGTVIEGGDPTKKYNFQRIFTVTTDVNDKTFILQFWHGLTTFAAATLRTSTVFRSAAASERCAVVNLMSPKSPCNYKLWARCMCETGGKYIEILIGIHTYIA